MSTIQMSSFLRRALLLDSAATTATGLLLVFGAPVLADMLGLPKALLVAAGIPLVPFAVLVAWLGTLRTVPPAAVWIVISSNTLWVLASVGLLLSRVFEPTVLGIVFVIAQAVAVAAFVEFQFVGLRRAHV